MLGLNQSISYQKSIDKLLIGVFVLWLFSVILGITIEEPYLGLILPIVMSALYMVCFKLKQLYYLLFFFIPLSAELELPGGLGIDFPAEPFLWILFVVTVLIVLNQGVKKQLINPISGFLAASILWLFFTAISSVNPIISLKFLIAKLWFILPFYLLPFYLFKDNQSIRPILKSFALGTF